MLASMGSSHSRVNQVRKLWEQHLQWRKLIKKQDLIFGYIERFRELEMSLEAHKC